MSWKGAQSLTALSDCVDVILSTMPNAVKINFFIRDPLLSIRSSYTRHLILIIMQLEIKTQGLLRLSQSPRPHVLTLISQLRPQQTDRPSGLR